MIWLLAWLLGSGIFGRLLGMLLRRCDQQDRTVAVDQAVDAWKAEYPVLAEAWLLLDAPSGVDQ